jgi:hypothetical protein
VEPCCERSQLRWSERENCRDNLPAVWSDEPPRYSCLPQLWHAADAGCLWWPGWPRCRTARLAPPAPIRSAAKRRACRSRWTDARFPSEWVPARSGSAGLRTVRTASLVPRRESAQRRRLARVAAWGGIWRSGWSRVPGARARSAAGPARLGCARRGYVSSGRTIWAASCRTAARPTGSRPHVRTAAAGNTRERAVR